MKFSIFTLFTLPFITFFATPLKQQEVITSTDISSENISEVEETTEDSTFHFIDEKGIEVLIFLLSTFASSGGGIALVELIIHHKMKKQFKNINEAYEKMDKQMSLLESKYSSVLNENIESTQKVLDTMNAIQPMIENLQQIRSSLKDVVASNPLYVKNGTAHEFVKKMNDEDKLHEQSKEQESNKEN